MQQTPRSLVAQRLRSSRPRPCCGTDGPPACISVPIRLLIRAACALAAGCGVSDVARWSLPLDRLTTLAPAQVTAKRLRKARIISDVVDGVSLDKTLLDSFVIDYGSSSVDCGGLFPKSQASEALCALHDDHRQAETRLRTVGSSAQCGSAFSGHNRAAFSASLQVPPGPRSSARRDEMLLPISFKCVILF